MPQNTLKYSEMLGTLGFPLKKLCDEGPFLGFRRTGSRTVAQWEGA